MTLDMPRTAPGMRPAPGARIPQRIGRTHSRQTSTHPGVDASKPSIPCAARHGGGDALGYNVRATGRGEREVTSQLRDLPSVQRVLSEEGVRRLVEHYSHDAVVELVRSELDAARRAIRNGGAAPESADVAAAVADRASARWRAWPVRVVNATGVVLHTNLGRAPLSDEALDAIERAAKGYGDPELDLETGRRGSRQAILTTLTRNGNT